MHDLKKRCGTYTTTHCMLHFPTHLIFLKFKFHVPNHPRWYAKWKLSWNMYTLHKLVFAHLAPICMLSRCLLTKISASELSQKFLKECVVGLVGGKMHHKRRAEVKLVCPVCLKRERLCGGPEVSARVRRRKKMKSHCGCFPHGRRRKNGESRLYVVTR